MENHFAIFPYVWLTIVAGIGLFSLAKGVHEVRCGEARARLFYGYSEPLTREGQPFYYWAIVAGDFAGVFVCGFMFWMGLDMLKW